MGSYDTWGTSDCERVELEIKILVMRQRRCLGMQ